MDFFHCLPGARSRESRTRRRTIWPPVYMNCEGETPASLSFEGAAAIAYIGWQAFYLLRSDVEIAIIKASGTTSWRTLMTSTTDAATSPRR